MGQIRWTGRGRGSAMARRAAFFLLGSFLLASAAVASAGPAKPRVASAGICPDHFLLALADDDQIVSVSWQAAGPNSYDAERAARFPANRGAAEEFLHSGVEVLLLTPYEARQLEKLMPQFGVEVVLIPTMAVTFEEIEEVVRNVSARIDQPARGEELIAEMRRRLEAIPGQSPGEAPQVAYFRPEGGGAGRETFVDTALRHAGFRNLQADLGISGWGKIPLEQLVITPPEGVVTSYFEKAGRSVNSRFGSHSLYRHMVARAPLIQVPGQYWPCSSPAIIEAVELLAARRQQYYGASHE